MKAIFERPGHPYTRALLDCLPGRGRPSRAIGGELPSPVDPPDGCRFADRCPHAIADCRQGAQPALAPLDGTGDHDAACLFHHEGYDSTRLERDHDRDQPSVERTRGDEDGPTRGVGAATREPGRGDADG